ncbi:winged helix-turn-helix transcriptional regulator [Leptospira sp. GIMC2001]|uniref:winged helix-turn-helix transcriptional regulator n=1 Tax=Leptospira sp. GIMC2001 TaxID=1513297 RepID=UPI002349E485|nr:helix-turn-helix domain-containing protein [Leptospira sp. GIMC2001]WCL49198.1 helix-turn-helix domain-containing protein [Leptospira sp. GIMC2001]
MKKTNKVHSNPCQPVNKSDLKFGNALLLFQEKWYLFILEALLKTPMGFNELSRRAKQVNPRTLSSRMQTLEKLNLVRKETIATNPPKNIYKLTLSGRDLSSVFKAIRKWSDKNGWMKIS